MRAKIAVTTWFVITSLLCSPFSLVAQDTIDVVVDDRVDAKIYKSVAEPAELSVLLERLFGSRAPEASSALDDGSNELLSAVEIAAEKRAAENLDAQITERRDRKSKSSTAIPANPGKVMPKRPAPRRQRGFVGVPLEFDWRRVASGFQPLYTDDEKPEIKMSETDKEIKAEGTGKKTFETNEAKGTRTQKAETRYTKDGKTFGVEIKNTQVIDAVSKPEGKSFRQEISMTWGADVAACPDVDGFTAGKGLAKVISKTSFTENGETVTMTTDFDIQAKVKGFVDDQATFKHYDLEVDAYLTVSGGHAALQKNFVKELKVKDGRYGMRLEIPGNTIEVSDGKYGGKRTPAKMGKVSGSLLTQIPDADAKNIGEAIGKMIPAVWNSANEMYKTAERHWRNYGCVEVRATVAKTTLEPGEEIAVSTETVHLQDGSKVNAEVTAEAYEGDITPEQQSGRPAATFTFRQTGESSGSLSVQSVSKRGIGKGDVEFQLKNDKEETVAGLWTGTIKAERKRREEKEKRSGSNLAENGGHLETSTSVQLQLTGQLDRTVDATNAYIATISGSQQAVDFEYDRYKIDEGYCGPNAVPYKGPKEITRTSTTSANYNGEARVFLEIGPGGGVITFSLPEIEGTTVHKYVHRSPCAEHDRVNTNDATDEQVATAGGSFSFSFPVASEQRSVKGSVTVQSEDGTVTTYSWELLRK